MSYELFEHTADVGIRGKGNSLKEAFSECGNALLEVMYERKTIKPKEKVYITAFAESKENLLINYLNELLTEMDLSEKAFNSIKVKRIYEKEGKFFLNAECFGETLDFNKHNLKIEVKAATYSGLKIQEGKKFIVECIVDV
jgi:SHS2 domain-containing protein